MNKSINDRIGLAIGVTGGIACGKNEVGTILESLHVCVLDTDDVAHNLLENNPYVLDKVIDTFGRGVLDHRSQIDRKKLGLLVFSDPHALNALNSIIHPEIITATGQWLEKTRRTGCHCAVLVPLLFEINMVDGWDCILCVASSPERMIQRMAVRGLSRADAAARMAAQWPVKKKAEYADDVIWNNGSLEDLRRDVTHWWCGFLSKTMR